MEDVKRARMFGLVPGTKFVPVGNEIADPSLDFLSASASTTRWRR